MPINWRAHLEKVMTEQGVTLVAAPVELPPVPVETPAPAPVEDVPLVVEGRRPPLHWHKGRRGVNVRINFPELIPDGTVGHAFRTLLHLGVTSIAVSPIVGAAILRQIKVEGHVDGERVDAVYANLVALHELGFTYEGVTVTWGIA